MPTYNFKHSQFNDELRWNLEIDVKGLSETDKELARAEAFNSILTSMGSPAVRPAGYLVSAVVLDEIGEGERPAAVYSAEIKRRIEKHQVFFVCTGISLPYLPA